MVRTRLLNALENKKVTSLVLIRQKPVVDF